jgi:hypothetical protein
MEKTLGELLCPHCQGERIELGVVDGDPVTIPSALRRVTGRDGGLWVLECGHKVLTLGFSSAQEWLELDGKILRHGHLPLTELRKGRL